MVLDRLPEVRRKLSEAIRFYVIVRQATPHRLQAGKNSMMRSYQIIEFGKPLQMRAYSVR